MSFLCSFIGAFGALEWLLSSMCSIVLHEVALVIEDLFTNCTDERCPECAATSSSDTCHDSSLSQLRSLWRKPYHFIFYLQSYLGTANEFLFKLFHYCYLFNWLSCSYTQFKSSYVYIYYCKPLKLYDLFFYFLLFFFSVALFLKPNKYQSAKI